MHFSWPQNHFGNRVWTFQQDLTHLYRVKSNRTSVWPILHSSSQLRLSPMLLWFYYSLWSTLGARSYSKPLKFLKTLKRSLNRKWKWITPTELRPFTENFSKHLHLCISVSEKQEQWRKAAFYFSNILFVNK